MKGENMKKAMNQSTLTTILNVASICALVLLLILIFINNGISGQLAESNEQRYLLTYNANRFMNGSAYLTNEVRAFAATGLQEHYDNYWNEVNYLKNRDLGVAAMQEIGITAEEQSMIDSMSALSNELVPLEEQAMEQVQNGQQETAIDYVYGKAYSDSLAKITSLKEQFLEHLDTRSSEAVHSLSWTSSMLRVLMVVSLLVVGILQAISIRVIRKRILSPVFAVRDQMGEISQGNLSAEFNWKPDSS